MTAAVGPAEVAQPLGSDAFLIDTYIAGQPRTTGCYLILGSQPALIETGPATCAPRVIAGLAALGVGPADLATIAVTHIHLDHAGGVGDLASAFPGAQVVVHPQGARHLVDPARLMDSARRVYGDALDGTFGRLAPTDRVRVTAAEDGMRIRVNDRRHLTVRHSPGHARHHMVFFDETTSDLYTGDAAGMYVPDTGTYKPTTPPPEFDLDAALRSLAQFRAMDPARLMFSHFGPGPDVDEGLAAAEAEVRFWVEEASAARARHLEPAQVTAQVRAAVDARYARLTNSPFHQKWEDLSSTDANVGGIVRWLENQESSSDDQS